MITIDPYSRMPIYEQLCKSIMRLAALGVLKADEQLPSVRGLARDLGINPNTVQKAYQDLERDGMTYSVAGRGSFIRDVKTIQEVMQRKLIEAFEVAAAEARDSHVARERLDAILDIVYAQEGERTK